MALTLTSAIGATDTVIQVTGTVPADVVRGYLFALDNEVLRFGRYERDTGPLPSNPTADDTDRWSVERGVGDTTKATHAQGTSLYAVTDGFAKSPNLTPPSPFGPLVAVVDLTSAQIATGVHTVIASPGAGKAVVILGGFAQYKAGLHPFKDVEAVTLRNSDGPVAGTASPGFNLPGITSQVAQIVAVGSAFNQSYAEDQPINVSIVANMAGPILTSELGDNGTGWVANDTFTVDGGDGLAAGVVDTVSAGHIVTYHLTVAGSGYGVGTYSLIATSGVGVDGAINVVTITEESDGTMRLTFAYLIADLLP